MPDVREVYEMITKEKPPEPGALERQQKRQVRAARNKRIGAFAVAAAIAVAAVALILETRGGQNARTPANQPPTAPGNRTTTAPFYVPGTASLPFFLDLRTGERTPLAENLAGGYNYVASPDGTRLAYSSSRGCAAGGVTVANIDGTDARKLDPPKGRIYCAPRWSPDGTKLVYQERAATDDSVGNLVVQDLSSGRRTQITDVKLTRAWWYFLSPIFSPDGRNVIFHLPRSSSETTKWDVWSVPLTGGEPTLVLRNAAFPIVRAKGPEGGPIAFVLPLPNDFQGRSLMIARRIPDSDDRHTWVVANDSIWWPTMSPDETRIAYQDGGSIYVVDLFIRESTKVADGDTAEWLNNDTLIVAPLRGS